MILIVNQIKKFRIRDLFIYSRTTQELQAALDLADEERNDRVFPDKLKRSL